MTRTWYAGSCARKSGSARMYPTPSSMAATARSPARVSSTARMRTSGGRGGNRSAPSPSPAHSHPMAPRTASHTGPSALQTTVVDENTMLAQYRPSEEKECK